MTLNNVPKTTISTERLKSCTEIVTETVYGNSDRDVFYKIANLKTLEKFFEITCKGVFLQKLQTECRLCVKPEIQEQEIHLPDFKDAFLKYGF